MKKLLSIIICVLLICISAVSSFAEPYAVVIDEPNQVANCNSPLYLDFDGKITLTGGACWAGASQSAITIAPGRDVIIEIPAKADITLQGGAADGSHGAGAGIEVPEDSSLTIIGYGKLKVAGGKAGAGLPGENGKTGYITDDWFCYSGEGGRGGDGGGGAGAGIGSKGGDGGEGGAGGAGIEAYADGGVYQSGNNGCDGQKGHSPSNFGQIKISTTVQITYRGGDCNKWSGDAGAHGGEGGKTYTWCYGAWGGGGGGAGGGGCAGRGIGSGGWGGGAGGGGGSGATYRFWTKASLEAAEGTGYGGKGGYGAEYQGETGGQETNAGFSDGYSGGSGGRGGTTGQMDSWDAQDIFFEGNQVGTLVSDGSLPIIIGVVCVVIALISFIVIKKKKAN